MKYLYHLRNTLEHLCNTAAFRTTARLTPPPPTPSSRTGRPLLSIYNTTQTFLCSKLMLTLLLLSLPFLNTTVNKLATGMYTIFFLSHYFTSFSEIFVKYYHTGEANLSQHHYETAMTPLYPPYNNSLRSP
jgi:hypothetical protein